MLLHIVLCESRHSSFLYFEIFPFFLDILCLNYVVSSSEFLSTSLFVKVISICFIRASDDLHVAQILNIFNVHLCFMSYIGMTDIEKFGHIFNSYQHTRVAITRICIFITANLDAVPNPQAGKPSTGCVRVKWNKIASGNCFVKYEVQYKDNAGTVRYTNDGTNIGETRRCRIPAGVNITQVQLKISFKSVAKNFTINVLEGAIPTTPAPTTKPKTTGEPFFS